MTTAKPDEGEPDERQVNRVAAGDHWVYLDRSWAHRLGVRKTAGTYRIRSRDLARRLAQETLWVDESGRVHAHGVATARRAPTGQATATATTPRAFLREPVVVLTFVGTWRDDGQVGRGPCSINSSRASISRWAETRSPSRFSWASRNTAKIVSGAGRKPGQSGKLGHSLQQGTAEAVILEQPVPVGPSRCPPSDPSSEPKRAAGHRDRPPDRGVSHRRSLALPARCRKGAPDTWPDRRPLRDPAARGPPPPRHPIRHDR